MYSDKQPLMDAGNYEVYNRDIMRLVFPRIIEEVRRLKPRAKIGDIIALYFVLLTNISGQTTKADGKPNPAYEACFLAQDALAKRTGIGKNRLPVLVEVLRRNGLLADVRDIYAGTDRYKYYYPSFCPRISDDGYVVDADGERIVPDYGDLVDAL